jgi:hypothetical protein
MPNEDGEDERWELVALCLEELSREPLSPDRANILRHTWFTTLENIASNGAPADRAAAPEILDDIRDRARTLVPQMIECLVEISASASATAAEDVQNAARRTLAQAAVWLREHRQVH